jgi:phosphate acetyltransferase
MKKLFKRIAEQAKKHPKKILFPEGVEPRVLQAVEYLASRKLVIPFVFATKQQFLKRWPGSRNTLSRVRVIDPSMLNTESYAKFLVHYRKQKGKRLSLKQAGTLIKEPMYLATVMLARGEVDGVIAGAGWPTSRTLRPALQLLRKKDKNVSSFFIMKHFGEFYLFADCVINITPTEQTLANIALATAASAKNLIKIQPRIAMLSFSTHGSTNHEFAKKIHRATQLVKKKKPDLEIDGELQADSALKPGIGRLKSKKYKLQKPANVLIFPDLQSANISYKLVEWLGHYEAIGPITQNLEKPVNDLSRGCTSDDIIKVAMITAVQAQQRNKT